MSEIADDIWNEQMERQTALSMLFDHMVETCEHVSGPHGKPCQLVHNEHDESPCPFMCAICRKEFDL